MLYIRCVFKYELTIQTNNYLILTPFHQKSHDQTFLDLPIFKASRWKVWLTYKPLQTYVCRHRIVESVYTSMYMLTHMYKIASPSLLWEITLYSLVKVYATQITITVDKRNRTIGTQINDDIYFFVRMTKAWQTSLSHTRAHTLHLTLYRSRWHVFLLETPTLYSLIGRRDESH